MKTDTTKPPYKMADEIFIVMEKLGLDPIKDVRSHYAIECVAKSAFEAGYKRGLKEAGSDLV
jgi:hypothetical protein